MYRSAIIGCGRIGGGYDRDPASSWSFTHAGAYRLCRQIRLVAAADADERALSSFGRKWGVTRLYTDYREMLERHKPDILSLCLPTPLHYEAFREASSRGARAIFCEKPLSLDVGEARDMARLSVGRTVAVNYFRRWNPTLARLRSELGSGSLGRPLTAVLRYTKGLFGNASHLVDLARWLWGEPSEVRGLRRLERPDGDPGVDFLLRFPKGPEAYVLHVPDPGYVFLDVDLLTEQGRVVIGQRGQSLERFSTRLEPHYRGFRILRRVPETETRWRECLPAAVREISRCLAGGGQPSCTAQDGLRAVEICREAAGKASRRGR